MPKAPDPLAEFVRDQLRDWAPVATRRLFGGWGVYAGPVMFGLIARDTIYFRVDEDSRPDYEAADGGSKPFLHAMSKGKTVAMAYYAVPAAILEDCEALAEWAGKAHAAALRARVAKVRPKRTPAAVPRSDRKRSGK